MRIPHEFRAYGKTWRVRWWENRARGFGGFNPQLHHAYVDEGSRTITMHSDLKGRPRQAFEAFVHEIMHIVSFEESKRVGRSKFRITHDVIHHLDEPLAFALMGMGVSFRCVCVRCDPSRRASIAHASPIDTVSRERNESCIGHGRRRGMSLRPRLEGAMAQGGRGGNSSGNGRGGRGKSSSSSSSSRGRSSSSSSRSRGRSSRGSSGGRKSSSRSSSSNR
jgi:hypothetical protein